MFSSLPQGTLVLGATQMPSSIFHASELGAELVKRGWVGRDTLQHLRCWYASPIEWLPIRRKDNYIQYTKLHTSWVRLNLNAWTWTTFHGALCSFFFFFQLQFSLLSTCDKADCMLIAGWLSYHDSILVKTFHVPCGLLHPADSIFFIQTFIIAGTVLLVIPLLKTTLAFKSALKTHLFPSQ